MEEYAENLYAALVKLETEYRRIQIEYGLESPVMKSYLDGVRFAWEKLPIEIRVKTVRVFNYELQTKSETPGV